MILASLSDLLGRRLGLAVGPWNKPLPPVPLREDPYSVLGNRMEQVVMELRLREGLTRICLLTFPRFSPVVPHGSAKF